MKYVPIIFLLAITLFSCSTQKDHFSISGNVQGVDTGMVYLQKYDSEKWINFDSTKLNKGEFSFNGTVQVPETQQIVMKDPQFAFLLFVENSKIDVKIFPDSVDKSIVKGSSAHDAYRNYLSMKEPFDNKMNALYQEWKNARDAGDIQKMNRADSISTVLDNDLKKLLTNFVKENPATVVSPYLVMRNSWQFELPELEEMVAVLDTSLNNSVYTQKLRNRVEILKSVQIGMTAPDFAMNDSLGNPITLSSLKGKVLLVDFWAAWCRPCREENPNVVKAYKMYNKKGFDILGVSFDEDREKWLKAIKQDELTWHHVSDLQGWANAAGKLYGINSIPANVLLDKDQKIIARNLRGKDLTDTLAEIIASN